MAPMTAQMEPILAGADDKRAGDGLRNALKSSACRASCRHQPHALQSTTSTTASDDRLLAEACGDDIAYAAREMGGGPASPARASRRLRYRAADAARRPTR